jgi:hypothetical protein
MLEGGSGGGGGNFCRGGGGGGAVELGAANALDISGTVDVRGHRALDAFCGAGAGGGVLAHGASGVISGTLDARGGDSTGFGGSGGGGRIVVLGLSTTDATLSVGAGNPGVFSDQGGVGKRFIDQDRDGVDIEDDCDDTDPTLADDSDGDGVCDDVDAGDGPTPVEEMVQWANDAYGSSVVHEGAARARLQPSTWEVQTQDLMDALVDRGCVVSSTPTSWTGGALDGGVLTGTYPGGVLLGSYAGGQHSGTLSAGDGFGADSARANLQHVASLDSGGGLAGHWVRTQGRRGVFHGVLFSCDSLAPADALQDWFPGDLSDWP